MLWGSWSGAAVLNFGAILVALYVVTRFVERRPLAAVGLGRRHAVRHLLAGAALSCGLLALIMTLMAVAGWYHVLGTHLGWHVASAFATIVLAASFEELAYRGGLFRLLEEWLGTWLALIAPALLFALGHLDNPHTTPISALTTLVAGVWTALMYVRTRALWLPIGAHVAWNFVMSALGLPVSGLSLNAALVTATMTGPPSWTGGPYGLEAGWPVLIALLPVVGRLARSSIAAGHVKAPSWRRERAQATQPGADRGNRLNG
ncbi:CPBP family intramembrane glutamic endopeptidase [[Actinomadura] parvosata]|uniref:CPBP family intramembrane glutamic endopeptidase n=1 Tax=[Actinomadura] parvosata TaxID=1955412 RepID=UPI0018AD1DEE|nr:CPBP family intramembrane glutamic endopeptidase [Nonomuraea sp. ATCC 55076]